MTEGNFTPQLYLWLDEVQDMEPDTAFVLALSLFFRHPEYAAALISNKPDSIAHDEGCVLDGLVARIPFGSRT